MFIIILIILVLVIAYIISQKSIANKKLESINTSNVKFDDYIKNNSIEVTKFVDIPTLDGCSKFIVDEKNNNVYYLVTNNSMNNIESKKLSFKDIIKCELIKDSNIKMVEDKFSMFDNLNQKEYIKKLGLRITFNDLSFTHLDILFWNSKQGQTVNLLKNAIENTNNWIQIMNIVIERGKNLN